MIKSKRKAREAALRALYQMEIAKLTARDAGLDMLFHTELPEDMAKYADGLVKHYAVNKKEIDGRLSELMRDWDYNRIAAIDRNLLRMAATELLYEPDIPPAVTINEAVEIAKKYGAAESPKFVNGVLGSLLKSSTKAEWEAPAEPEEAPEPEPEPEEEQVSETEADKLLKAGLWRIRGES
jgi:N utilization substance protein B